MGNNPSSTSRAPNSTSTSTSASASPSTPSHTPSHNHGYGHDPSQPSSINQRAPSTRRGDPRTLIQNQRTAAAAEASLAQARGTTATVAHRPRNSQSIPAPHLNQQQPSPSQSIRSDSPMGAQNTKEEAASKVRDIPSKPVNVPRPSSTEVVSSPSYSHSIEPSGPSAAQDMSYHLTRPPRLPLPIEEEVHTPGSPIIAPTDIEGPVLDVEALDNDPLPRRASALSNTTVDEEDAEELRVDKSGATVPYAFDWQQGGEKVYVTGTIFQWNKKHRLHPVNGQPGLLRAIIHVRPGTHHIRFIADGVMQCSTHLPTTVDFGNNLVNYIEVSADDLPTPDPAPVADAASSNAEGQARQPSQPAPAASEDENAKTEKPTPKTKPALPPARYTSQIPQYLLDLDKAEDSTAYQYAAAAIEKLPTPPSLPGFLGKPILNAATPMKDDNSVLTMPNHTVLNHLATSSIKNNVLAVSATTRYRRKYVTTIMYKPTSDD